MYASLQQIIEGGKSVTTDELNNPENIGAGLEIQTRLCDLGLLDPTIGGDAETPFGPVAKGDGKLGLNSRNALLEFCKIAGIKYLDRHITLDVAKKLLEAEAETFLPIQWDDDRKDDAPTRLAKKVLRFMRHKGYWLARSPRMHNIIYIEGVNSDGTANADTFNEWNDRRMVVRIAPGGKPELLVNDQATTEPGAYYTKKPMNPQGAARLAFGQYKAWVDGLHQGKQPALVQRDLLRVHRDLNKDGKRSATDPMDVGKTFGVNQHTTSKNKIPDFVGPFSAGCLVGRRYQYHLIFLKTVKKDVRYLTNKGYMFMSAVLAGDEFLAFGQSEGLESTGGRRTVAGPPVEPGFAVFDN